MLIEEDQVNLVKLEDLNPGDVFMHIGYSKFLLTNRVDGIDITVVDLECGALFEMSKEAMVRKVNFKGVILRD